MTDRHEGLRERIETEIVLATAALTRGEPLHPAAARRVDLLRDCLAALEPKVAPDQRHESDEQWIERMQRIGAAPGFLHLRCPKPGTCLIEQRGGESCRNWPEPPAAMAYTPDADEPIAAPQPTADGVVRAVERAIIIRPDPPRNTTSYAWGMYDARQTALVAIRAAFAAGRKHGE